MLGISREVSKFGRQFKNIPNLCQLEVTSVLPSERACLLLWHRYFPNRTVQLFASQALGYQLYTADRSWRFGSTWVNTWNKPTYVLVNHSARELPSESKLVCLHPFSILIHAFRYDGATRFQRANSFSHISYVLFHLLHKNTHANLVPVRGLHMSCRGATRRASLHPSMVHFCFCVFLHSIVKWIQSYSINIFWPLYQLWPCDHNYVQA